jgi:nitrile hydratase accessory protein
VLALHERGVFTWPEWSSALAREIGREPGETYYRQWLAALERVVADKQLADADADTLARHRAAWERAAERTPHGTPIELAPQDFQGSG